MNSAMRLVGNMGSGAAGLSTDERDSFAQELSPAPPVRLGDSEPLLEDLLPVTAMLETEHGLRQIQGTSDLCWRRTMAWLIDHESFLGRADQWSNEAFSHTPQLSTYSRALTLAGQNVLGRVVHFPVGGGSIELA